VMPMADILSEEQEGSSKPKLMFGTEVLASKVLREVFRSPFGMPFTRFVEIGRICTLNYGNDFGHLCAVIEVLDQNRILVEGPKVPRQVLNVRRINLTPFKVDFHRGSRSSFVLKAMEDAKVQKKFDETVYGKSLLARRAKMNESDFERFQRRMATKKAAAKGK